jgi:hypothetical protein
MVTYLLRQRQYTTTPKSLQLYAPAIDTEAVLYYDGPITFRRNNGQSWERAQLKP